MGFSNDYCLCKISFLNNIFSASMRFHKTLSNTAVFNIENNKKCILSGKSAYYNYFKSNQIKSLLLSHHHSTSALVSEILMSVLQTVQKNNRQFTYGQYIFTDFLKDLVTLKTGVMAAENTVLQSILKYKYLFYIIIIFHK